MIAEPPSHADLAEKEAVLRDELWAATDPDERHRLAGEIEETIRQRTSFGDIAAELRGPAPTADTAEWAFGTAESTCTFFRSRVVRDQMDWQQVLAGALELCRTDEERHRVRFFDPATNRQAALAAMHGDQADTLQRMSTTSTDPTMRRQWRSQARHERRAQHAAQAETRRPIRAPRPAVRSRAPRRRKARRAAASTAGRAGPGDPPPPDSDDVAEHREASARATGTRTLRSLIAEWLAQHGRGTL